MSDKPATVFHMHKTAIIVATEPSENQCKQSGHKHYEYTLRVTCSDKLDTQGFVIDHLLLGEAITEAVKNKPSSCEQYCSIIATAVETTLKSNEVTLLNLLVKVKPLVMIAAFDTGSAFMELERKYN